MKNRTWTKTALAISACLCILWWILGAGATVAWFTDTSDDVRNQFHIGMIDMDVYFKNDVIKTYTPLDYSTAVFDDQALYEPGYTQVVFFKIENSGDVDFHYKLSVTVDKAVTAKSVLGNEIYLPNYLRYGAVFGKSEETVIEQVSKRLKSWTYADSYMLNTWSELSPYIFEAGEAPHYGALILYMPVDVGNAANYRGTAPEVELGLTVYAQQTVPASP